MNTVELGAGRRIGSPRPNLNAIGLVSGLTVLALPAVVALARSTWVSDEQGHGPVLLAVAVWLIWQQRAVLARLPRRPWPRAAGVLLVAALLAGVLGHSQRLLALQVVAPWLAGVGLLAWQIGPAALRLLAVPLLCLLLVVPLPGMLVQQLTLPLKIAVSDVAEALLHAGGWPVARTGVVLAIDQYQLLVADACAGLTSMFTLEAMGLVYIQMQAQIRGPVQPLRQGLLAVLVVPIAFIANVVRVCLLVLVTYYLGDAAGRGYAHSGAGVLLFVVAMLLMLGADALLGLPLWRWRPLPTRDLAQAPPPAEPAAESGAPWASRRAAAVSLLLPAAIGPLALALQPSHRTADAAGEIDLQRQLPRAFGAWQEDSRIVPVLPDPRTQATLDAAYSQVLARTYADAQGRRVMLSVAYGNDQGAETTAVHRPEFCYRSLGFEVAVLGRQALRLPGRELTVQRLQTQRDQRSEPVSYWVTLDRTATLPGLDRKWQQLRLGLQGWIPDGMVVRVSTLGPADAAAFALQDAFIADLHAAVAPALRARYFGGGAGT